MQDAAEDFWPAEEDAGLGGGVDLADRLEDGVPVGTAEIGRGAEARDGVCVGVGVVDHDVGGVVGFDVGG